MSGLRPGTAMGRIAALEQDVRAQAVVIGPGADDGTHLCPGRWRRLPQPLKGAVLRARDGGRGAGSSAHLAAIKAAIAAANRQEADR
jgi:hypothetical protein